MPQFPAHLLQANLRLSGWSFCKVKRQECRCRTFLFAYTCILFVCHMGIVDTFFIRLLHTPLLPSSFLFSAFTIFAKSKAQKHLPLHREAPAACLKITTATPTPTRAPALTAMSVTFSSAHLQAKLTPPGRATTTAPGTMVPVPRTRIRTTIPTRACV